MSVRDALVVVLLVAAACELEPPPKQKPAAPAPAPAVAQPAPAPAPPAAPADAGAPQDDVSAPCMQIGVHFADVWISEAKDPQDKAQLEQERTLLVRRTALACTQGAWSDDVRSCITAAKTRADVQACEKKIVPATPAQR